MQLNALITAMTLTLVQLHSNSYFRKMFILVIYSANFNATTCLTTEIFAFKKVVITIMQDYARTVHLRAVITPFIVVHINALDRLMYVARL
jgi:hypothetical protein